MVRAIDIEQGGGGGYKKLKNIRMNVLHSTSRLNFSEHLQVEQDKAGETYTTQFV